MDEHDCDTCRHFDKYGSEYPCNKCDSHYSQWEHTDDDEDEEDFELIDKGFIFFERKNQMNIETIPEVPIITDTFAYRKKSNLVKYLMSRFDLIGNKDFAAEIVGCSTSYFNNKLHRDSFSIDEIIALTEVTDLTICFLDKNGNPVNKLSAYEWFDGYKEDYIQRLNDFKDKQDKLEYDQYLELKIRVDEYEREHNVKGETENG